MATAIQERLGALATAHRLVRPSSEEDRSIKRTATLAEIVRTILRPYMQADQASAVARASVDGPELAVGGDAVATVAMVLHELATNAAKYGAFSRPDGRVEIVWAVENDRLALSWTERGGPPIAAPPKRQGFGSQLSRHNVTRQLGGALSHHWDAEGLTVRISAPAARLIG